MKRKTRRYLFASYDSLRNANFDQYEKVCDRLFLFVPNHLESIPIDLVIHLQKLGKGLKWIKVQNNTAEKVQYIIAFMLGKLHEKLPLDIEFAVLDSHSGLDDLIQHINDRQRRCLRILESENTEDFLTLEPESQALEDVSPRLVPKANPEETFKIKNTVLQETPTQIINLESSINDKPESGIRSKAVKVTEWLMRTGNRPSEINLLKQYINLNHPDLQPGNAYRIITYMAMNKDIKIEEKQVMYNF